MIDNMTVAQDGTYNLCVAVTLSGVVVLTVVLEDGGEIRVSMLPEEAERVSGMIRDAALFVRGRE